MSRTYAILLSLLFGLVVLSPVRMSFYSEASARKDGFPLSWYPMFRGRRPTIEKPRYMIGLDAEGKRHKLDYKHWARGGMNQARPQLARIVQDRKRTAALCEKVARKMAKHDRGWRATLVEIQIVRGHYSRDRYFSERETEPLKEVIYRRCPVPGRTVE